MSKKILLNLLFFLIPTYLYAGYVNSYVLDYSSTTETTTMGLKGDMYLTDWSFTSKPTTGYIELHSTGTEKLIVNNADLYITGTGALKFSDGSRQTTSGVGSADQISSTNTAVITFNATNSSPTAKISFKNYNTEIASIDSDGDLVCNKADFNSDVDIIDSTESSSSTTGSLKIAGGVGIVKKLYVGSDINATGAITGTSLNTGQGANELYAMDQNVRTSDSPTFSAPICTTLNVDNIQTKTASGDLLVKNQAGSEIAIFQNTKRFYSQKFGELIYSVGSPANGSTHDIVVTTSNAFLCIKLYVVVIQGGSNNQDVVEYLFGNCALNQTLTQVATATSLSCHSAAFLSSSGAPNYNKTIRITITSTNVDSLSVFKVGIY